MAQLASALPWHGRGQGFESLMLHQFMKKKHKSLKTLLPLLPTQTYSVTGKPCEPVTLIVIGKRHRIIKHFIYQRWYLAVGITPLSALRAFWATVFSSSYLTGPVSPLFIRKKTQQLAFQRPTRTNTFRRRHHLRLWKTSHTINGHRVWVGMLSYDRGSGFYKHSLFPTHHISSNLSSEENFLARSLRIARPTYVRLGEPAIGIISNGDPYTWDGKALVVNLSHAD